MALTALDAKTALIVVDLQKGIIGSRFIHAIGPVVDRTVELIGAFRKHRLPIVLVNVAGVAPGRTERQRQHASVLSEDFTDFIPQIDRQPDDIVVTKRTWGAFASTDLDRQLKSRGVTQVVITGVATGTGVESTARQAYEQGFNVTLAIDAMTDARTEAHEYSINQIFPRLGETGTAHDVMQLLASRSE